MPVSSKRLDSVLGALAHPTRRQILVILFARGGMMTAGEIAERFKHSWPTITRHLGVLESADLLQVRQSGRQRVYSLQPAPAREAAQWILEWAESEPASDLEDRPDWTKLAYASMSNVPDQAEDDAEGAPRQPAKKKSAKRKTPKKKSRKKPSAKRKRKSDE